MQTFNFADTRLVATGARLVKTVLRGKFLGEDCSRIVTDRYAAFWQGVKGVKAEQYFDDALGGMAVPQKREATRLGLAGQDLEIGRASCRERV